MLLGAFRRVDAGEASAAAFDATLPRGADEVPEVLTGRELLDLGRDSRSLSAGFVSGVRPARAALLCVGRMRRETSATPYTWLDEVSFYTFCGVSGRTRRVDFFTSETREEERLRLEEGALAP